MNSKTLGKGSILFHKNFQFKNGAVGRKLLVVLNNPNINKGEEYLTSRTTTSEKGKKLEYGCNHELSYFFLPAKHDFFEKNTWIQLHEIFPFDAKTLLDDKYKGELEVLGELDQIVIRQLMNCIKKIKDIEIKYKKMILKDKNF
jgi:hypothetical protein